MTRFIILGLCFWILPISVHAACAPQAATVIKECTDAVASAKLNADAISTSAGDQASGNNIQTGAAALQSASAQTAGQAAAALTACRAAEQKCASIVCNPSSLTSAEKSKCTNELSGWIAKINAEATQATSTAQGAAKTQSAAASDGASNSGGLSSGTLTSLATGALLGAAAAYLITKKNSDSSATTATTTTTATDTSALGTGTLNCSAYDGFRYSDCDTTYSSSCYGNFTSDICNSFSSRYCASTTSVGVSVAATNSTTFYTMDATGAGIGSSYCQYYIANGFCSASTSRSSCPSCLLLVNFTAEACKTNPTLCMAQNSPEQIAEAKNTCPTDPMFSDPTFAEYGSAAASSSSATTVVVLPQSISTASDVGTEFGPGLFSISSKAIANRLK